MNTLIHSILNAPSLAALPQSLAEGISPVLISGTNSALRAVLAAGLYRSLSRPVVVLCSDEAACEHMAADLRSCAGEAVARLYGRDLSLRNADAVSREGEQSRLRVLDALASGRAPLLVATAQGLMQRTVPRDILTAAAFSVTMDSPPIDELEAALLRCGYRRTELVEGCGQYSRRGGILDVFSPGSELPLRVEYWDDEVDSMGLFDPETQRRCETVEEFRVLPSSEVLPGLLPEGTGNAVKELRACASRSARKKEVGDQLARTLREDAERLEQGMSLPWSDRYLPFIYEEYATGADYLPDDTIIIMDAPGRCGETAGEVLSQLTEDCALLSAAGVPVQTAQDYMLPWAELCRQLNRFPVVLGDAFTAGRYVLPPKTLLKVDVRQLPSYGGSTETAVEDVKHFLSMGYAVAVLAGDERRVEVLAGLFEQFGIDCLRGFPNGELPPAGRCCVAVGAISSGLDFPELPLAVLTDSQLAAVSTRRERKKKAVDNRRRLTSCADLSVGDLVVHEYHGIGRYAGIFRLRVDGADKDYVKIIYAGSDSLYVPATQLDLVSKYIGAAGSGEDSPVKLSKMGGTDWHRTKQRTRAAVKELAEQLLKLYARRQSTKGFAFSPDSVWQTEFEDSFGYAETEDQLRAIREIKADMESDAPMDRLLCGDVGYGKTEVALRAVMKCLLDNKQAVLLCPTTVLARQHYQTASQRFFGYPVNIDTLTRFRTPNQVKRALEDVRSGRTDLLIGTHRVLSKDVKFKDLGLVVVDEEQRFGVTHKEKLKELTAGVDVLTLSATPIPRTLNMALSGIRSLSSLEEPPAGRQGVRTYVLEHNWPTLVNAMRSELRRGGQVYYLHNRIEDIERTALKISGYLEGASVAVAHGKMNEVQLSSVMDDMVEGRVQVLVCTTIIETGIDIPNVNTLIIEDADRLGLAQLHQIRGRVGRSSRRASAYLTYKPDKVLTEIAEKRLAAIREFAEFNAGFQIAMRDLEIRGAGNLLGAEQSGHMIDVGYDLYLKMLEEAVQEQKGETPEVRTECSADLSISASIPDTYVSSSEQRMDLYRRIALIRVQADADDMLDELIDRFGDPPGSVQALIRVALLRGQAGQAGITDISQKNGLLRFQLNNFTPARVGALSGMKDMAGRVKVEAGKVPCVSFRLKQGDNVLDMAGSFVAAWNNTEERTQN